MRKESMDTYYKLEDPESNITTYFRKFTTGVWIFQFKNGKCIGQVLLNTEHFNKIYNAPEIQVGDGTTQQTL